MALTYLAPDAPFHLVFTGEHARGNLVLPDGTAYDVSEPWIEVSSHEHAGLVSHLIGVQHEAAERLGFAKEPKLHAVTGETMARHVCTDHCGELARPVTAAEAYQAQSAALASTAAENAAVNAITALVTFLSLHTASPSTTGANEVAGGSYARVSVTWASASGGSGANSNSLTLNLPASTTAAYFGGFTAVSSGTYEIGGALSPNVTTGTSAGTVTIAIGAATVSAS